MLGASGAGGLSESTVQGKVTWAPPQEQQQS
jgi:hypothetical protein